MTTDNRHLISDALDDTLVVEAAAGTGKTTELVGRVVRLIETGRAERIDQIVAVTFSEKAAGELKLRLREELERARLASVSGSAGAARLEHAVQRFEESHVSTIHGFCADLLRERPVEAFVDPAFSVLTEGQAERLFDEAFADWIQQHLDDPSEGVRRSLRRPRSAWSPDDRDDGPIDRLRRAGLDLLQWRDHPAAWRRPAGFDRDREVEALVDALKAFAALSSAPISRGDLLFRNTEDLRRASAEIEQVRGRGHDDFDGWEARLCGLAARARDLLRAKGSGAQFSRTVGRQAVLDAREHLVAALVAFRDRADADLAALVHADFASCIEGYERRKQKAGALDFLDLLMRARNLIRENEDVRREFQDRFRFILVDEFQDTDPLQASLLLDLASDPDRRVRPGALFIVGDPKQSIYRFRRADVGVYHAICQQLVDAGATRVPLRTSFRSVPAIQRAVNAAFSQHMVWDAKSLQAGYVELRPDRRDHDHQPAVVALPVPRPYGRRLVTLANLASSLPEATGEFVRWLIADSGWTLPNVDGTRRPITAGDICLLFRRFIHFQDDVTEPYVEALESRGVPHLLVGGKSFHEREEVDALRNALTAIEWPGDALSVFATLRGPFFAIGEEELLVYHALGHGFRPYDVPDEPPASLAPVVEALGVLRELNRLRNHRPVADTIGQLMEVTRAHAGFVLWRGGEQVLANVLQIAEMARKYEADGGLSFRGFVDELREAAARAPTPEAPIVEEGTDGVRLMTVHKAKGLEFPVVILADIGCKISRDDASRYLDSDRGLSAIKLGGWTPVDLAEHNAIEASRDRAEGVRLAYVAATRARDLLVVPNVGDGPYDKSWVDPLAACIYPPLATRQSPSAATGVPEFRGKDTVLERPDMETATSATVRPGAYAMHDPVTGAPYTVVWWDPLAIDGRGEERRGLRREHLITRDAKPEDVAADRARFESWQQWRTDTLARGSHPSMAVLTATEWARAVPGAAGDKAAPPVIVEAIPVRAGRPAGRRFGTLVHAVLAAVPLDATADEIYGLAGVHARLLSAPPLEARAAAVLAEDVLRHPLVVSAHREAKSGRSCLREVPVSLVRDGVLIDGQADLAFESDDGWVVVDFKTDGELGEHEAAYRRQVALYAEAITHATGRPARGVLLRV
ncbi:MAG TPA: UvrD-helicase domain-containing protein [Patescibacteria group bacterium]|nr:UvrD-helicase domain-containing protein [Patescibacteria group bacterium]